MDQPQGVEAIKLSFKQHNEGDVISFRLHPDERCRSIAEMPLGTRVMLAIVEIEE